MIHIYINFFVYFIMLLLIVVIFIRQKKHHKIYKKNSDNIIKMLSNNIISLTELQKKHEIVELKKSIDLYSNFQIILKLSNCDYVTLFKYDYSKRYIVLHFILSIDNNGKIINTDILDKLPLTANLSILDILKSDGDLYLLSLNEIKNDDMFTSIKSKGINTIYYKNIFKNEETPFGFISLGYKNENHVIPTEDKIEILRIVKKMKSLI